MIFLNRRKNLGLTFWKNDEIYTYPSNRYNDTLRYNLVASSLILPPQTKFIYPSETPSIYQNCERVRFEWGLEKRSASLSEWCLPTVLRIFWCWTISSRMCMIKGSKSRHHPIRRHSPWPRSTNGIHLQVGFQCEAVHRSGHPRFAGSATTQGIGSRAPSKNGPFTLLREWKSGRDGVVHEYRDTVGERRRSFVDQCEVFL